MDKKQLILDFLRNQQHMVVATVDKEGKPEAALVCFAEIEDLSLIFGTNITSRKAINLQNNAHIAVVFGYNERITVQYEGKASIITEDVDKYKQIYFKKSPSSTEHESEQNEGYIKIIPSWIRYTDIDKKPEETFELNF
jgi:pyridoxine/pyridoxamine 5'-phosphate oxidase